MGLTFEETVSAYKPKLRWRRSIFESCNVTWQVLKTQSLTITINRFAICDIFVTRESWTFQFLDVPPRQCLP